MIVLELGEAEEIENCVSRNSLSVPEENYTYKTVY